MKIKINAKPLDLFPDYAQTDKDADGDTWYGGEPIFPKWTNREKPSFLEL